MALRNRSRLLEARVLGQVCFYVVPKGYYERAEQVQQKYLRRLRKEKVAEHRQKQSKAEPIKDIHVQEISISDQVNLLRFVENTILL